MIVVGIVRLCPQKSPFAFAGRLDANPECRPSGKLISNTLIGASGTVSNELEVIPLLILTFPVRLTVTPSPCKIATTSGNAAPPCETRYTGPDKGFANTGVLAVAVPICEPTGQPAGLAANCASVHACWIVDNRAGNCLGNVTSTFAVFA